MQPHAPFASRAATGQVQLMLQDAAGDPWPLTLSPAMVRFIGRYPRVEGIGRDGGLLLFRSL